MTKAPLPVGGGEGDSTVDALSTAKKRARTDPTSPQPRKWRVICGERAAGIRNPIREIMDTIAGKENPKKQVISLAQGDPTAYSHLRPSEAMVMAVVAMLKDGATAHGYQPSQGAGKCRDAIAKVFSVKGRRPLTAGDVFMTLGCSEALSHCIAALARKGGNVLLPRPGFPLYQVLCEYHGLEPRYYDLLPDRSWEVDIARLTELVDDNTCALLINNPSNPCGAVYSRAHLEHVLGAAENLRLPIIADEVYADMSFVEPYVACAEASCRVPVLSVCALSKKWLAPGWRVGWVTVHDADEAFQEAGIPEALLKLCQVSLGPSAPLQAALPEILCTTPPEWHKNILGALKESAQCCTSQCQGIPGLELATEPQGAMYCMVRLVPNALRDIGTDDVAFAGELLKEESVAVLPGACFNYPGYFRVVFAAPSDVLRDAWARINEFCRRRCTGVTSPSSA